MARPLKLIFLSLLICMGFGSAQAEELEPIRLDLRLTASDLVDEVVYSWLKTPPLGGPTHLIVAEIDGPVGLDTRFDQDVENHLYEVLRANPNLPLQLVHCSLCRQWVSLSEPRRSLITRALNLPETQAQLQKYPHLYALSLHFDVVKEDLALWAEIYEVAPPQKIVWSQRFSQRTSARSVLREPSRLISITEAREEQRRILSGQETFQTVTRFPMRMFSAKTEGQTQALEIPPVIFLEQSFEAILSPRRNRRAGLQFGLTSMQNSMQGWSFGMSYQHLLFRNEPSLTNPDTYFRAAVNHIRMEGPGAAAFQMNQLDIDRLLHAEDDPRVSLTAFQLGIESHVKHRFGFSVFVEYMPALESSPLISTQKFIIPFHSIGFAGVLLW